MPSPIRPCVVCGSPTPTRRHKTCGPICRKARNRQSVGRYVERKQAARRAALGPLVACRVCGLGQGQISPSHLAGHGLTMALYRGRFPDAPLVCDSLRRTRGKASAARMKYLHYPSRTPDPTLYAFLTGALLGDGSLERGITAARYSEGGKNEAYLRWKYELLRQYFPATIRERLSKVDKRTGKQYRGWWVRTAQHPLLGEWRRGWYAGRKVVPRELVLEHLDGFALAVWHCDDGHLTPWNIFLNVQAFGPDEVGFLSGLLVDRFGIENWVRQTKCGPMLVVSAVGRRRLLGIVREFPFPGMAYKLGVGPPARS